MRRAVFNQAGLRAAKWLGLTTFCARTSAWLLALNSRRIRRLALPVLILLALPVVNSGRSVGAGFVVDVGGSGSVAVEQSSEQSVIVAESSCHSGASFSGSLRRTPPPSTQNVRPPCEFPARS